MTDQHLEPGSPQAQARDAVRRLPLVRADAGYEESLHRRFVYGVLGRGEEAAPAPKAARSPGAMLGWATTLAAAAVLAMLVLTLNRGPAWQVAQVSEGGTAVVDGSRIALDESTQLQDILGAGSELVLEPPAGVEMTLPGILVFEVTPGTRMTVPQTPGRWFNREVTARVEMGEVRFLTGSRFPGNRLLVSTPEASVEVTGTVVSVFRDPGGTCVCVMNGEALVGPEPDSLQTIPDGMRMVIPADGKPPYVTEIQDQHRAGMLEFTARHSGENAGP